MKIGSLVELVNDNWTQQHLTEPFGIKYPVKGKIYTVRGFDVEGNSIAITLEEIINPVTLTTHGYSELFFKIYRFREIQYNSASISELLTESKEAKLLFVK